MRLRWPAVTSLAAIASLLLAGCTGSDSTSSGGNTDALTVGTTYTPVTLDPSGAGNGNGAQWYITLGYAPLLRRGASGKLVPGLATKWGYVGNDKKTFEVTLRPGLRFADGSPLHAKQLVASVRYFKKGTGPSSPYFRDITVKVAGKNKVIFTSSEPDLSIPTLLTEKWMGGSVISPAGLAKPQRLAGKTFGAGPYVLDSTQTVNGDHYVYTPNKYYYDKSQIHYKKITIKVVPSATSLVQALRSGQMDVIQASPDTAPMAEGVDGFKIVHRPVNWDGLYFLDFQGKIVPALGNVKVRRALNYAIDRKSIVKSVYGKYGIPNEQPTTPGDFTWGYSDEANSIYAYDPKKAKRLLAEAGYPKGFAFTAIYKTTLPAEGKMIQAVAGQLAKVGVRVSLKQEPNSAAWGADLTSQKYPATAQTTSSKPAVMEIPYLFMPHGILNPFNAENSAVNQAYEALRSAAPDDVSDAAKKAIRTSVEQALSLPVVAADDIFIYNDRKVAGVKFLGDTPTLSSLDTWTPIG